MSKPTIAPESPDQPDVLALLAASDDYHAELYPTDSNHLIDVAGLTAANARFLVARASEGTAIGCGAIMLGRDAGMTTAELKRMWVDPQIRGTGLGRRLLQALEAIATNEGAELLRLETGIHQPDAIRFYESVGYNVREPFGDYGVDPLSVFMEKASPIAP